MKLKALAFIFLLGLFATAPVYAYSTDQYGSGSVPLPYTGTSSFNFDFSSSFQNLLTPFAAFFNNLSNSIGNQPVVGPANTGQPSMPTLNLQNINFQNGPQELDQWFSSITHLNFSEIMTALLTGILWVLGLTQQFIQWLLGFVRK